VPFGPLRRGELHWRDVSRSFFCVAAKRSTPSRCVKSVPRTGQKGKHNVSAVEREKVRLGSVKVDITHYT